MLNWNNSYGNSSSGWGAWVLMGLMMVVVWGVVVTAVVFAVRGARARRDPGLDSGGGAAGHILDERFARGELSADEYTHRRDLLHISS